MTQQQRGELFIKSLFIAFLLYASYTLYISSEHWIFMSNVNLIFHEAGHVVFAFFWQYLYVLGGTLGEIGVPLLVAAAALFQHKLYVASFSFWWLSTALYSVSVYAADARERALPLITGDVSSHDWHYLLSQIGLLQSDNIIGNLFFVASISALVLALFIFWVDVKETIFREKEPDIPPEFRKYLRSH